MALQIRDMCDQLAFDTFIGRRMADASMETPREILCQPDRPCLAFLAASKTQPSRLRRSTRHPDS